MLEINNTLWFVKFVSSNHPKLYNGQSYALGSCDTLNKIIYINENLYGKKLKKVLCHELMHAVVHSYNIRLSTECEEALADIIASYGQEVISITNYIYKKLGSD